MTCDTLPACPEAPFTGSDGIIWPVSRPAMTDRYYIITRMAEDCSQLIRDCGVDGWIQSSHLAEFGWTFDQIARFCGLAMTQVTLECIKPMPEVTP